MTFCTFLLSYTSILLVLAIPSIKNGYNLSLYILLLVLLSGVDNVYVCVVYMWRIESTNNRAYAYYFCRANLFATFFLISTTSTCAHTFWYLSFSCDMVIFVLSFKQLMEINPNKAYMGMRNYLLYAHKWFVYRLKLWLLIYKDNSNRDSIHNEVLYQQSRASRGIEQLLNYLYYCLALIFILKNKLVTVQTFEGAQLFLKCTPLLLLSSSLSSLFQYS